MPHCRRHSLWRAENFERGWGHLSQMPKYIERAVSSTRCMSVLPWGDAFIVQQKREIACKSHEDSAAVGLLASPSPTVLPSDRCEGCPPSDWMIETRRSLFSGLLIGTGQDARMQAGKASGRVRALRFAGQTTLPSSGADPVAETPDG